MVGNFVGSGIFVGRAVEVAVGDGGTVVGGTFVGSGAVVGSVVAVPVGGSVGLEGGVNVEGSALFGTWVAANPMAAVAVPFAVISALLVACVGVTVGAIVGDDIATPAPG